MRSLLLAAAVAATAFAAPAHADHHGGGGEHAGPNTAVCVLIPTSGSRVNGTLKFVETDGKVTISGTIRNLTPGKHGFHIHEFGDISDLDKGKSTGGHFAPGGHDHGKPSDDAANRHVGDLGNIEAGPDGVAQVNITDSIVDLHGENSIIGRGVVVHAEEDKFTQPTGDAGGRVAIGTIGVAKDTEMSMAAQAGEKMGQMKKDAAGAAAEMKKDAEDAAASVEKAAEDTAAAAETKAKNAAAEMKKEADEAAADAKKAAADAERAVKDTAKDAENAAKDAAADAEKAAGDAAEATKNAASDALDAIGDAADEAAAEVSE